ncbi:uncharacterized protein LOC108668181, partial [Hyalella azteca]|uniref:Uncharacterized protein LOC108668181 n=1 Tax=Hyalella azteca TaxID=294128 RepID=A0A8B7NB76_HYAAZ
MGWFSQGEDPSFPPPPPPLACIELIEQPIFNGDAGPSNPFPHTLKSSQPQYDLNPSSDILQIRPSELSYTRPLLQPHNVPSKEQYARPLATTDRKLAGNVAKLRFAASPCNIPVKGAHLSYQQQHLSASQPSLNTWTNDDLHDDPDDFFSPDYFGSLTYRNTQLNARLGSYNVKDSRLSSNDVGDRDRKIYLSPQSHNPPSLIHNHHKSTPNLSELQERPMPAHPWDAEFFKKGYTPIIVRYDFGAKLASGDGDAPFISGGTLSPSKSEGSINRAFSGTDRLKQVSNGRKKHKEQNSSTTCSSIQVLTPCNQGYYHHHNQGYSPYTPPGSDSNVPTGSSASSSSSYVPGGTVISNQNCVPYSPLGSTTHTPPGSAPYTPPASAPHTPVPPSVASDGVRKGSNRRRRINSKYKYRRASCPLAFEKGGISAAFWSSQQLPRSLYCVCGSKTVLVAKAKDILRAAVSCPAVNGCQGWGDTGGSFKGGRRSAVLQVYSCCTSAERCAASLQLLHVCRALCCKSTAAARLQSAVLQVYSCCTSAERCAASLQLLHVCRALCCKSTAAARLQSAVLQVYSCCTSAERCPASLQLQLCELMYSINAAPMQAAAVRTASAALYSAASMFLSQAETPSLHSSMVKARQFSQHKSSPLQIWTHLERQFRNYVQRQQQQQQQQHRRGDFSLERRGLERPQGDVPSSPSQASPLCFERGCIQEPCLLPGLELECL